MHICAKLKYFKIKMKMRLLNIDIKAASVTEAANRYVDKSSGSVRVSNEAICIVGKR
jgi:hypothetical protein